MEAMASGCCIVASDTPPVKEMITSGEEGQLVDFFDPDAMAQQVDYLLQSSEQRQRLADLHANAFLKAVMTLITR